MFAPAFCLVWVVKRQWDVGREAAAAECSKVGCRAACPQAAAEVYGNAKPYGLPL